MITIDEVFGSIALLSDGYLSLKPALDPSINPKAESARRFFRMCENLPTELQMLICKKINFKDDLFYLSIDVDLALKKVLGSFFKAK